MARKKEKIKAFDKLPKGSVVRVLRPSMWSGMVGVVAGYGDTFTIIRVQRNGHSFDVSARSGELEAVKSETLSDLKP